LALGSNTGARGWRWEVTQEQGVGVALHTHLHQRQPARFDVSNKTRA
jgi:hypothetical protein